MPRVSGVQATLIAVSLAITAGAPHIAVAQKLLQTTDKFSGSTQYFTELRDAKLEGGSFISGRYVLVRFEAFNPNPDQGRPYALYMMTRTPSWIFISAGPSLALKLDGAQIMTLIGQGSLNSREVESSDTVVETAIWPLSEGQLDQIAHAKKVEFRIVGDKQFVTGEWNSDLLRDAAYFATQAPKFLRPEAPLIAMLAESAKSDASRPCPPTSRSQALGAPVRMGVHFASVTTPIADYLRIPSVSGVIVLSVDNGSAAEASGIKQGDILAQIGETKITSRCDVFDVLSKTPTDSSVPVNVWRQNGNWVATVTIKDVSSPMPVDTSVGSGSAPAQTAQSNDVYSQLIKLDELRKKGILTEAEFTAQKEKLLNSAK